MIWIDTKIDEREKLRGREPEAAILRSKFRL